MKKLTWVFALLCAFFALTVIAGAQLNAGDPNCDNTNNLSDLTYLIDQLFRGGPEPCAVASDGPIAAGVIHSDGTIINGTGNFTCTFNFLLQRYEITLSGEDYVLSNFVTHVTPISGNYSPRVVSSNGRMIIYLTNPDGSLTSSYFQFSTLRLPNPVTAPDDYTDLLE